ncbi:sensor histidine kinase, partial [Streptomyces sp. NPDC002814]
GSYSPEVMANLIDIQERTAERVAKAPVLTPLEASDREDALTDWLDDHGIQEGWRIAPTFVQAGIDTDWLDQIAAAVDEQILPNAIGWLNYTVETELLMDEINDSTNRISHLVGAAKQYSQLDRAPYQVADVHELLDSTLLMLSGKIGERIKVVKEYDRTLPNIPAYPAELNQVWTNLIDNAVHAINDAGGEGTLTVRTALQHERLLVEFRDTGPGVPKEIRSRIFDPFFTTKPVGEGTGLGLDISWRIVVNKHHGTLQVESEPGDTRFQVLLPLVASANDMPEEAV